MKLNRTRLLPPLQTVDIDDKVLLNPLLSLGLVQRINLLPEVGDNSVVLLTQIRQDGLVLEAVVVIVFLQFGQFRLSLAVQLDLVESSTK